MTLLSAKNISKVYRDMAAPVEVISGLDLSVEGGEIAGIYGASGSGKSTLLHILGGLDKPSSGSVHLDGQDISSMDPSALAKMRNRRIGFIFQFYHLIAELTALENVMLPALIAGEPRKDAERRAQAAIDAVELGHRAGHLPAMLSGGEQQRTALARATVMRPSVILADEPTGNLDHETGMRVWEYLLKISREFGMALVVVTHNRDLIGSLKKVYELRDKKLYDVTKVL